MAWHTFILHTRDYTNYCLDRFGHYIHHDPGARQLAILTTLQRDQGAAD